VQRVTSNPLDISILYVEDESAIREGYARALQRISKNVHMAENGAEGLELYKKYRPDIIVSDIRMPQMDGIDMVKAIKRIDPECAFIFTTAYNDSNYMLEALELQANGYLQKPVQKKMLQDKIVKLAQNILQRRESEEQQKELERQKAILQNVLDHEKNLLVVTDFQKALFANRAFLETFGAEDVEAFNKNCIDITSLFLPFPGYLHKGLCDEGEPFYDLVERSEDIKRMVTMIGAHGEPKAYHINISRIVHDDLASFLISLTDITKMNIQKISTEKKAFHDALTGLYNRNKFDELFNLELNRIKRYGVQSSLVILDIDHFKRFNDTYGHLIGDKVLVSLAKTVSKSVRNTDIFARWGGEEFILLLPETPIESACLLVEKLRKEVSKIEIEEAEPVTASFGVTQLVKSDTLKSAFQRADEALYMAKGAGRNCVKCVEVEEKGAEAVEDALTV
jgi:diguanylate cyclase (GGDEF)-like protein